MTLEPTELGLCPACGSTEFITEPAVDAEGLPTGRLLVRCDVCGADVGEIEPPPPAPEAEPQPAEEVLLPSTEEEPETPEQEARRRHVHPVWP